MKISNLKIILLLVLGAFTLTLPNTVRAETNKTHDDWVKQNLRDGRVTSAGEVDVSEHNKRRNELLDNVEQLQKDFDDIKETLFDDTLDDTDLAWDIGGAWTWIKAVSFTNLLDWSEEDINTQKSASVKIRNIYQGYRSKLEKDYPNCAGSSDEKCKKYRDRIDELNIRFEHLDKFDKIIQNLIPIKMDLKSLGDIKVGTYIYTDPKTNAKIYFEKIGDSYITVSGVTKGCIPMPAKLAESKSCIFCPLFKVIYNAAQSISTNSFTNLGKSMALVILMGFSIYVAFSVLKLVSSFTKQDGPKFITTLLGQAFKVLFAYILLLKYNDVYQYIIGPVLSAGLEFGTALLFKEGHKFNALKACGVAGDTSVSSGVLPNYLYVKLICFIKAVQAEIATSQTIGSSLMCVSRHASASEILIVKIPDFSMMFQGLIIFCFGWLISLAFAFYLIDATVRLGIVGALMPFLIACWPFKVTSSYTGKGWEMFMNSFFTYVMMGLVVSINIELMGSSLTGGKGGFEAIEAALNGDSIQTLRDLLDIGFSGFLILIACCLFGFKLSGQATELAGKMSSGGTSPIGSMIGGLAASGAKGAALGVGKKGLSAASATASYLGEKSGVTPALRRGRDKALGAVGRVLGFGKNSGAAGGSKARAAAGGAAGGASTTAQSSNKPTPPNTPPSSPTSSSQAQQAQGAGPRNNGNNTNQNQDNNGAADPVMNRRVQNTMQEADKNIHNYVGNKRDNDVAWDKYQKSEASLKQAKSDYENAQRMATQSKGTPDEAKYAAAAEKAAQRYAGIQKSHSQNEQNVQDTQDKMNDSAINAYVNQQKAIAQRNGKAFDENKSREYARTHLDEIKKNLDTIVKADPRYN